MSEVFHDVDSLWKPDERAKDDGEKVRVDLLPFAAVEDVARVMTFGARKYGERSWHGLTASRLFGAALRHLWAWWRGEDADPETGLPHLAHAACCMLMIGEQMIDRPGADDRPRATVETSNERSE